MREILFRGRMLTGEWVYGYYWTNEMGNHFIKAIKSKDDNFVSNPTTNDFEVNPETVGQYTGLTDKNGKKIFEGDIVYITKFYNETYHRGCEEDNNLDTLNLSAEVKHEGSSFMFEEYYLDIFDKEELEVIGNIHDNPELVEEELK